MKIYLRAYVNGVLVKTSRAGKPYSIIPALVGMTPLMLRGSVDVEIDPPGEFLLECSLRRDEKSGFSIWVNRVVPEDEEI